MIDQDVLIYQFGQCGSATVLHSLRKYVGRRPKVSLEIEWNESQVGAIYHLHHHTSVQRYLDKQKPGDKVLIINLIRDPIQKSISSFFQDLLIQNRRFQNLQQKIRDQRLNFDFQNVPDLITIYENEKLYEQRYRLDWFDQMNKTLGINVYKKHFNPRQGYQIYQTDRFDLIILRTEDLDRLESVLGGFLGLGDFKFGPRQNSRQQNSLYQQFKKLYQPSDSVLNQVCGSQLVKHFYTDKYVQNIIRNLKKQNIIIKTI